MSPILLTLYMFFIIIIINMEVISALIVSKNIVENKLMVEKQMSIQNSGSVQIYSTKSAILCVSMCVVSRECCTVSYNKMTKDCAMDIQCNPITLSQSDSIVIKTSNETGNYILYVYRNVKVFVTLHF